MSALPWVDVMEQLGHDVGNSQSDDTPQSEVLIVGRKYNKQEISFNQRLDMEKAEKLGATAVYFQQFPDTWGSLPDVHPASPGESHHAPVPRDSLSNVRPASPQIYIFDKSKEDINDVDLSEIHKKLWSGSIVPIYYVLNRTHVKIYSARQPITVDDGKESAPSAIDKCAFDEIASSEEIIKTYHATMFRTGEFWRQESVKRYFDDKETVGEKLLQQLQEVRKEIRKNFPESIQDTICHLLMLGIFIKYLEERKDSMGNRVLPKKFFSKFGGNNFCDAIRKGRMTDVLHALAAHFNGEVFKLNDDMELGVQTLNETLNETQRLRDRFADFLDARTEGGQYVLWRLYDFNYIPVELISRIYEEFVSSEPGVAYTPVNLANLMIDECMPLHQPELNIKILDPSCGSGIFLVTAFRRMVHWRQYDEYKKMNKIRPLTARELKDIMSNSIYGYDIVDMAVNLSIFSLSIAMCDMLEPAKIWTDLRFNSLRGKNLVADDFFPAKIRKEKFDLIIGNPPFEDAPVKKRGNLPNRNKALSFLEKSMPLLKKGGSIAFVMPATKILYSKQHQDFREKFFHDHCVEQIMDFSFLQDKLFENQDVPTVVLFAKKEIPTYNAYIRHIVVRRTFNATRRIMFEFDTYDFHQVPLQLIKDPRVWKCNLLGGAPVYDVVLKLAGYTSLNNILHEGKKKGWVCSQGYTARKKGKSEKDQHAKWMPNGKTIITWTDDGIGEIGEVKTSNFIRPRDRRIYESPHLIISKILRANGVVAELDLDKNLRFNQHSFGIHVVQKDRKEQVRKLGDIARVLRENQDVHRFFLMSTSFLSGIGRSASMVQTTDIKSLPMPVNKRPLSLTWDEKIIVKDVLKYGDDALRRQNLTADAHASPKDVVHYKTTYCHWLNRRYAKNGNKFRADWIEGHNSICVIFRYCGEREDLWPLSMKQQIADNNFTFTSNDDHLPSAFKRIFVWSGAENTVIYIKPNTLRYWLGSIALRDAANFMRDMAGRKE